MPVTYKDSGVDVERGYKAVELMKSHTKATFTPNVLGGLGSFGSFFSIAEARDMEHPVLVSGTDGVGTKLKYAFILDKHDTIGIDAVAMCVNDVICQGAKPLFFLDYIASGRIVPEKIASIVKGMSDGCIMAGCSLVGGETAEMPGFYADGEYDIAGFCTGLVDKPKIITGKSIESGDCLIGIASSGLHSNGFSLVRKLFGEDKAALNTYSNELGMTIGEAVLTPTKIYVKTILSLIEKHNIKGIANITGGGFIENIPRMFPDGIGCEIDLASLEVPPIFQMLVKKADLSDAQAHNTFNMGTGMVLCVNTADADSVISTLKGLGEKAYVIGKTVKGEGVKLC